MKFTYILLLTAMLVSCAGIDSDTSASISAEALKIPTSSGIVQGRVSASVDAVVTWDDLPFAQPPEGSGQTEAGANREEQKSKISNILCLFQCL